MQAGCRPKVSWLDGCPGFSFGEKVLWGPQSIFHTKETVGMKAPCRHPLDLPTFSELCGCCPQQRGPTASLQSALLCPSISLGCLGISTGRLSQQVNQMQPSPAIGSPAWLQKMASSDSVFPITGSPHEDPVFRACTVQVPHHPANAAPLQLFLPALFLYPSPSVSHPFPPQFTSKFYSISPSQRDPYAPP